MDLSFGTSGIANLPVPSNMYGFNVASQADGKILVAYGEDSHWSNTSADFSILRLQPDGSPDSTFGTAGVVFTDFDGDYDCARSITVQPDGKILVYGISRDSLAAKIGMVRYESDGTLDMGFGSAGKVKMGERITSWHNTDAVIQADGKILIPIPKVHTAGSGGIGMVRLHSNGSLDTTFDGDGEVRTDPYVIPGAVIHSQFATVLPNEKIMVSGYVEYFPSGLDYMLAQFNSNGSLDSTFGSDGIIVTPNVLPNIDGGESYPVSLHLLPDGKVLVGGEWEIPLNGGDAWYLGFLIRYLTDLSIGILDFSQEDKTLLIYPNPVQSTATLEFTLKKPERLFIDLHDKQGRKLKTLMPLQSKSVGVHKEQLYLEKNIPTGTYLLVIGNGHQSHQIRIIKQ